MVRKIKVGTLHIRDELLFHLCVIIGADGIIVAIWYGNGYHNKFSLKDTCGPNGQTPQPASVTPPLPNCPRYRWWRRN